jgi:hypothetical protein
MGLHEILRMKYGLEFSLPFFAILNIDIQKWYVKQVVILF